MKVHIAATLCILFSIAGISQGTEFDNITYKVYDDGELIGYSLFQNDTMSFSDDGIAYEAIATIMVSGNIFAITDISLDNGCEGFTGTYNFTFVEGLLEFQLINDPCEDREETLVLSVWQQCPNDLEDLSRVSFTIYPNPVVDEFSVAFQDFSQALPFLITDISGRIVVSGLLTEPLQRINVMQLTPGSYFLSIGSDLSERHSFIKL